MTTKQPQLCCNPECPNIGDLKEQKNCMRCSRCHKAIYCSKLCQCIHWAVHKQACSPPVEVTTEGPFVLLLCLDDPDMLASIWGHLISALRSKVRIIQALNSRKALQHLADEDLKGVVVADHGIVEAKNSGVLSRLVEWVRFGGIAVVGCLFPSFVSFHSFDLFFKEWGLPWTMGEYGSTSTIFNPLIRQSSSQLANMAKSYNMKAVTLEGVKAEDILYARARDEEEDIDDDDDEEDSTVRSNVFPPSVDLSNVPVAHTRISSGFLGYVGDVNGQEEATNIILAMLRL